MKINPSFPHDIFKFLHKPIRDLDVEQDNFTERYLKGMQQIWEDFVDKIIAANSIFDPEKCREDLLPYLKDIVGLTKELDNITSGLSSNDLRKIILLAVPLWKQKGLEVGFSNIIRLFTGFNARVFNWFDYRMIVGEKAIGEEQLGEDAWLISMPGVEGSTPVGTAFLLLQFENRDLRDGSLYRHKITPYGNFDFASGGPHIASENYIFGDGFGLLAELKDIYDWSTGLTIEYRFKTSFVQNIPLFHWYDADLDKGIRLYIDTDTDEITYAIQDGDVTQTQTISAGKILADDVWHHLAWVVDWDEGISGELSLWLDNTRLVNTPMNASFIKTNIHCLKNIQIGMSSPSSSKFHGSLDGIRITNDPRYTVSSATIVAPGANFLEYIEEQLDEFQIDVRVVDNGTLDRTLIKRILNLMRPCSERINIIYINFYEDFIAGKGQYETISGSSYVEKTDDIYYLKMSGGSLEQVDVVGSTDWENYLCQQRCIIYSGNEIEIRFLIQDPLNYYAFRLSTLTKLAHIEKSVAGVRTALAAPKTIDVEAAMLPLYIPGYVYMVSCFKNENTGMVTLKTFIDSNLIFEVNDSTFIKGTFGIFTPIGSTVWCSEAEMFELPLDHERINPNDVF